MSEFIKKRKHIIQIILPLVFLMGIDTFVTSELSTRKGLEASLGDGYAAFEGVIALLLIGAAIFVFLKNHNKWARILFLLYNGLLTFALLDDVRSLMIALPRQTVGFAILLDAFLIWATNLAVFALWYWMLDGGGPQERSTSERKPKFDLMFPQEQQEIPGWEKWKPSFVDYIFLSFYSSMAFTPTDTLVLSKKMKFLLMLQAAISVVVLAMIGARAINLLG